MNPITDRFGNKIWRNEQCQFHREDGPAWEGANGYKAWYQNDQLHRLDGPAEEDDKGNKRWWVNGELHRTDGPARIWANGSKEWFLNGEQIEDMQKLRCTAIHFAITHLNYDDLLNEEDDLDHIAQWEHKENIWTAQAHTKGRQTKQMSVEFVNESPLFIKKSTFDGKDITEQMKEYILGEKGTLMLALALKGYSFVNFFEKTLENEVKVYVTGADMISVPTSLNDTLYLTVNKESMYNFVDVSNAANPLKSFLCILQGFEMAATIKN